MNRLFFPCLLLASLAVLFLCALKTPNEVTGEKVVRDMYNRWNGKWYPHFAFEQKAIFFKDGQVVRREIWQEILTSPGNLHIRFDGFNTGNGVVYTNDSVYLFKTGTLQSKRRETNFLALLGFDVYFYQPATTIQKLVELGFDLSKSYTTTFKNRPVMVVGTTDPADRSSSQFWVDTKRHLVLRAIKNTSGIVRDVHFNNYKQIEKNWVATEMVFTNGADTLFVEEYFNMKFPKKVQETTYNPSRFVETRW